jgi:hypothetical protein
MNRAQRIQSAMREFFADEEAPSTISPEDTIIKNQTPGGIVPLCPTCGRDLLPGLSGAALVQCPLCMTDVNIANGNFPYRTKAPNMSRGAYGS